MPFATDEAWPSGLVTNFHAFEKRGTWESRLYGPLDKLLNYCFADAMNYVIHPQSQPRVDEKGLADFIIFLVISDAQSRPVMIIEVENDYTLASVRRAADGQIRQRLRDMHEQCPNPKLFGLSVLGTRIRIYDCERDSGMLSPARVALQDPDILPSNYLAGKWDLDLLSATGLKAMQSIVAEIRGYESQ